MCKISIIVPVYNMSKYLDRCMDSLLKQTFKDIEIILVDDGSTDDSLTICKKYAENDNRVKVYTKENEGLGLTRNYGIERANGDYICFVDSDDYVTHDMCKELYESAIKNDSDVVYGGIYYDDNEGNIVEKKYTNSEKVISGNSVRTFLLDMIANVPTKKDDTIMEVSVWKAIFKKKLFDDYNIKFESERKFISEDVIFDIDYLSKSKIVSIVPACVYYYCINPNSLSKTFRTDRFDKVKVLYNEVVRKLSDIYTIDEYQLRTDRFLIARARTNIRKIVKHKNVIGKEELNNGLRNICEDKELKLVLSRYPINKLPFKYFVAALIMKNKCYKLMQYIF